MRGGTWAILGVLTAGGPALADVVHLKGGGELRGSARTAGGQVIVRIDGGEIRIPKAQVNRIEEETHGLETLDVLRRDFSKDPVGARVEAARFARSEGLDAEARGLWREVVARDPEHVEARTALGHRRVDGQWMDVNAQQRAKGLVRYGGRWVTPETVRAEEAELARLAERRNRKPRPTARPPAPPVVSGGRLSEDPDSTWPSVDTDGVLATPWLFPFLPVYAAPGVPQRPTAPPVVRPPPRRTTPPPPGYRAKPTRGTRRPGPSP